MSEHEHDLVLRDGKSVGWPRFDYVSFCETCGPIGSPELYINALKSRAEAAEAEITRLRGETHVECDCEKLRVERDGLQEQSRLFLALLDAVITLGNWNPSVLERPAFQTIERIVKRAEQAGYVERTA